MAAMAAAVEAGLLASDDAAALTAAWNLATHARNAVTLVRGRSASSLTARATGAISAPPMSMTGWAGTAGGGSVRW